MVDGARANSSFPVPDSPRRSTVGVGGCGLLHLARDLVERGRVPQDAREAQALRELLS
jgi:hypothetical protein